MAQKLAWRLCSALLTFAAIMPAGAYASCNIPASLTAHEVASYLLGHADYVGYAVVDRADSRDAERQVLHFVDAFKGDEGVLEMEATHHGSVGFYDSSRFRRLPITPGQVAFVALKRSPDGVYFSACMAAWIKAVSLEQTIAAVSKLARR